MIPRNEHPNPNFKRNDYIILNGQWDFEFDFGDSGKERNMFAVDAEFSKKINVPFCPESELSGIGYKDFMAAVWYKRTVEITEEQLKGKAFIVFGAVDFHASVYVNGEFAGEHFGGYTSFRIDATKFLKAGKNTITVCAQDDTRSPLQARGKQSELVYSHDCDYTRTTGIWQTVYMEFCPENYIKSVKYFPNITDGTLTIHAELVGNGTFSAAASWDGRLQPSLSTFLKSIFGRLARVDFTPSSSHLVAMRFQATSVFVRLSLQIKQSTSTASPFSRDLFLTRASTLTEFILHPLQRLLKMIFFFLWRLASTVQDFIRRFLSLFSYSIVTN